jgi:hypothetical protein
VDLEGFKPNDRKAVGNNIQALHAVAATLTKQPVFLLQPQEGAMLTESLCNVLDYHKINITETAAGPLGLYMALGATAFAIYGPRLAYLKKSRQQIEQPSAPPTPEDAAITPNTGTVDFSGDIPLDGSSATTH